MDEKTQSYITELIKTQTVITLNIAENNIPHACKIWYSSSNGKELYFLSRTATRQCQIINNYPQVMIVVSDPCRTFPFNKGVQIFGQVQKVCDKAELITAAAGYVAAFPASAKLIENLLPVMAAPGAPSAFYRVTVEQIQDLNTEAGNLQPDFAFA